MDSSLKTIIIIHTSSYELCPFINKCFRLGLFIFNRDFYNADEMFGVVELRLRFMSEDP